MGNKEEDEAEGDAGSRNLNDDGRLTVGESRRWNLKFGVEGKETSVCVWRAKETRIRQTKMGRVSERHMNAEREKQKRKALRLKLDER